MPLHSAPVRFGSFEFHPDTDELRRNGMLVRLPAQPTLILKLLIDANGEVVSRDAIREAVWGPNVHVDFDRGLTVAIAQIRSALGDSAESPRFIQTVPRRGYRFLPAAERIALPRPPVPPPEGTVQPRIKPAWIAAATVAVIGMAFWTYHVAAQRERTIAVLPFQTDGSSVPIAEELIGQLGQQALPRVAVLAYGSVAKLSFDQARARLNADYIVEGSVRKAEANLRVSVRLVESRTAKTVWSKVVERDATQLAGFEESTAAEIAVGLARYFEPAAITRAPNEAPCATGWEQVRTAKALLLAPSLQDLDRAIELLDKAVDLPGSCVAAKTLLADALEHRSRVGKRNDQGLDRARALAAAALQADPQNPEGNNAMAGVLFWKDWRFGDAESYYKKALAANPSYAAGHHDYAWLLIAEGKTGEALDHLRRAVALDPLSPRINIDAGWLYLQAHRFQEAARQAERALQLDPELKEARACWSRALYYLGDYDGALAQLRLLSPDLASPSQRNSRQVLESLFRARIVPNASSPYTRAQLHAWLGERDASIAALREAKDQRELLFPFIGSDPAFRTLAGDSRFEALKASLR